MRLNWITPSWRGSRYFTLLALLLLLSLGLGSAGAAEAPGRYEGVLGGAPYLINVPPDWNGGLVLFAHGYQGEGAGRGMVRGSPLDQHLTERGYAWAASGYRAWGYRPDWFLLDLLALKAHFVNRFGQPRWTIVHGQSMGGHISIASLELHPDAYQGALIECGVIDGVGLIDWLYAYTAAAQYFSELPLLDTPRPEFDRLVYSKWLAAMGEAGRRSAPCTRQEICGSRFGWSRITAGAPRRPAPRISWSSVRCAGPGIAVSRMRCGSPPSTISSPGSRRGPCRPAMTSLAMSAGSGCAGRRSATRRIRPRSNSAAPIRRCCSAIQSGRASIFGRLRP